MKKKVKLSQKRKMLEEFYKNDIFKCMYLINALAKKSAASPEHKFDNLYELLSDEGMIYQAIGNISTKKGALTKGPKSDERTIDALSLDLVEEISTEIELEKFKFKPIRRIYMDKSGKKPVSNEQQKKLLELHKLGRVEMSQIKELKARPLGISSFKDKVVQEMIRCILNAIYEPEFARINCNFGFRPKYGCADAIADIQRKAKQMDYAIEGDVKGAFDNVNHNKLMEILGKKIIDKKFLKIIYGGLKCGMFYLKYFQESDIGTTQGSGVSPLLYNIYFHEFDKFINSEFKLEVENINIQENRKEKPINKLYTSISKKKTKLKLSNEIKLLKQYKIENNWEKIIEQQKMVKEKIKQYKELDKLQKKIPTIAKSRQLIRWSYHRYADDWVLFTNANLEYVQNWKNKFSKWIESNLQLELSEEKTKITCLLEKEYAKFLGFQLSRARLRKGINAITVSQKKVRKKTDIVKRAKTATEVQNSENRSSIIYKSRTTNPTLITSWDRSRVLARLEENGFTKKYGKTYRGKSKLPWTTLQIPEIIQRYNYILRGYIAYYSVVNTYPNDVLFLFYLLKFSCAHTLAQKLNLSLKKVFSKFGNDLRITYVEKFKTEKQTSEVKKTTKLMSWKECAEFIRTLVIKARIKQKNKSYESISIINKSVDEICKVKINWRTAYKISNHCCICGCTDKIEYHHVKHIKIGKVTGFLQIMKQLNRKQIPCCNACHRKIHNGEYDGMSLNQIYDEELVII